MTDVTGVPPRMNLAHDIPPVQSLDRNVGKKCILGCRTPFLNKSARAEKEIHVNINLSCTLYQISQISHCFQLSRYRLHTNWNSSFHYRKIEQEFIQECARSLGSKSSSIIPILQMTKPKQVADVICFSSQVVTEVEVVLKLKYLWLLATQAMYSCDISS